MLKLSRVNKVLLAAILVINLWVIAMPLIPVVQLWWQDHAKHTPQRLTALTANIKNGQQNPAIPTGDELIIPKISLQQPIIEGTSIYTVNKGVWRWPSGETPSAIGNTVLIGHRFTYLGPAVFAHLDLIAVGDKFYVLWNGRQYNYSVAQIKVVSPSDTSIIAPTIDRRVTIYTCTPMWTSKYRLAIIGQQEAS